MTAETTVSGFAGLVLLPDEPTMKTARRLAAGVVSPGAESVLASAALPHLTLTQCALREAPHSRLATLIRRLEGRVHELAIPLGPLTVFGGGFVFWCVELDSPARAALQAAHQKALTLADGALDPVANAAVVAGTATLTGDDPSLVANARRHGYAFVGPHYLPHITLGFDSRLLKGSTLTEANHAHTMRVARVALVRLGRYGVADSVIALADA